MYHIESPNFRDRKPEEIINDKVYFDSVGYTYRSLSWLDIAKKDKNICALQYAAIDCRRGIEQLLYEELVLSVGTELDEEEYKKCKDNPTKLYKIIDRLNPDYEQLAEFSKAIISIDHNAPPICNWDHKKLMKHWGKVSSYLHWAGKPSETVGSNDWIEKGLKIIEEATMHIWDNKTTSFTGILKPENMLPEIRDIWYRFKEGSIGIQEVKINANLIRPLLRRK